jgi:hypothetical protein
MAQIAAELATEYAGADFFASFDPAELVDAAHAWDEASQRASAEAFAIGVEAAALKAQRPALRDDLPALVVLERLEHEHERETAGLKARVAELETDNRALRTQGAAVGAVLRNTRLQATERIVDAIAIMELGSRASRGLACDPWRPTIDAPRDPANPHDPERVGLAAELGFSRNTVSKALDAFSGPEGPLLKRTVHEHDGRGRLVRSRIELRPSPTCRGGVPGMLWALARFDPRRPKPEPPEAMVCADHPEAKVRVRHTAVCTACGTVVDERVTTAPRPAPTHGFRASVAAEGSPPRPDGERTTAGHRPPRRPGPSCRASHESLRANAAAFGQHDQRAVGARSWTDPPPARSSVRDR